MKLIEKFTGFDGKFSLFEMKKGSTLWLTLALPGFAPTWLGVGSASDVFAESGPQNIQCLISFGFQIPVFRPSRTYGPYTRLQFNQSVTSKNTILAGSQNMENNSTRIGSQSDLASSCCMWFLPWYLPEHRAQVSY